MENIPGQMPGGVGKSGGIDPLVEDLAYRKFEEELVDTVIAALSRQCMEREDVSYLTCTYWEIMVQRVLCQSEMPVPWSEAGGSHTVQPEEGGCPEAFSVVGRHEFQQDHPVGRVKTIILMRNSRSENLQEDLNNPYVANDSRWWCNLKLVSNISF